MKIYALTTLSILLFSFSGHAVEKPTDENESQPFSYPLYNPPAFGYNGGGYPLTGPFDELPELKVVDVFVVK